MVFVQFYPLLPAISFHTTLSHQRPAENVQLTKPTLSNLLRTPVRNVSERHLSQLKRHPRALLFKHSGVVVWIVVWITIRVIVSCLVSCVRRCLVVFSGVFRCFRYFIIILYLSAFCVVCDHVFARALVFSALFLSIFFYVHALSSPKTTTSTHGRSPKISPFSFLCFLSVLSSVLRA